MKIRKKEQKQRKKERKAGKTIMTVLSIVIALIVIAVIAIAPIASKNVKAMNEVIDETLATVSANHKVTQISAGEFSDLKACGIMKFNVKQYEVEDLGNLSVMTVNIGLMQMATVVFSPYEKDIPLLSCDYMYILKNRTAFVEIYDLVKEKDEIYMSWMDKYDGARNGYSDLEDTTASSSWYDSLLTVVTYKKGSPGDDPKLLSLLLDTVRIYLDQSDAYPLLTEEEKAVKTDTIKAYSDRLIDEGGVSTDFFKKALGEDITRSFFDQVFFASAKYR